jgi:multiple sugar transport system substrate-binding protein
LAVILALLLASCGGGGDDSIYLQRFFGECGAEYGGKTDVAAAEGECGIITSMINKFNVTNTDVRVSSNVVAWPGYPQLTAQAAAGDPPDVVTMHMGVISDYAGRGLLEPIDPILREAGIDPANFTDAARSGVMIDNKIYGLPWDNHGGLFHVNTRLFAQAGLMKNGEPVLPNSAEELVQHARQFRERTGKPYIIQSLVGDPAAQTRALFTYLMAMGQPIFPDKDHVRLRTPEARKIIAFFRDITREGLATSNMDTPAAIAAFMNGEGGIYPTGTWMIGQFQKESDTAGRPLQNSYAVYPYPRLWGRPAAFIGGHALVVPKRERSPEQRRALGRFLRFMADHNLDWARTGHLPVFKSIIASKQFRAMPQRENIAPLATIGQTLPGYVPRQSAIEGLVGEEMSAAITGQEPIEKSLADAERRVNELLAEVD